MAERYIVGYFQTAQRHYELASDHFAKLKGYEYYGKTAPRAQEAGAQSGDEFFLNLQVWGTPEQCYRRIMEIRERSEGRAQHSRPLRLSRSPGGVPSGSRAITIVGKSDRRPATGARQRHRGICGGSASSGSDAARGHLS